jgi:hypothetical protein
MNPMPSRADIYVALIHHPVLNKEGRVVTTSVTNFDLHDLARVGRTFGVKQVFIVTPNATQINMVNYIKNYWSEGFGGTYNPDRKKAVEILKVCPDLEACYLTIEKLSGNQPTLVATTAKRLDKSVSYACVRERLCQSATPVLISFGTGFGLTNDFMDKAGMILAPVEGQGDYNHLSVRSAVSIILDRLLSTYT